MLLELPYPPSVNHYWKRGRNGHVFISDTGRRFREVVSGILSQVGVMKMEGKVALVVHLHPPNDTCDIDNGLKALLDALTHGGAYQDDKQVVDLRLKLKPAAPPKGVCFVSLEQAKWI